MKWRARSRAAAPCTTTPTSLHGILGEVSLSIKSGSPRRVKGEVRAGVLGILGTGVCWLVNLTQARVIGEEGTSIEIMPL